jgi:hypothetical protein
VKFAIKILPIYIHLKGTKINFLEKSFNKKQKLFSHRIAPAE